MLNCQYSSLDSDGPEEYFSSSSSSDEDNVLPKDINRPRLPVPKCDLSLKPPLPVIIFKGTGVRSEELKTITGQPLRPFTSNLSPQKVQQEPLQDILYTKKLIKWFNARGSKEAAVRQPKSYLRTCLPDDSELNCLSDQLVYKALHFDGDGEGEASTTADTTESLSNSVHGTDPNQMSRVGSSLSLAESESKNNLEFDSHFESGNLFKAVRVFGREKLIVGRTLEVLQNSAGGFIAPKIADQEYDLTIRNDLNTNGNIQWYFFSVGTEGLKRGPSGPPIFPLRVRFNIINMQKKDALYNYGMKPATFSKCNPDDDWRHQGEDVCYYKNFLNAAELDEPVRPRKRLESSYVLTFTYTFTGPDTVYFAHTFPYTYTDLKKFLSSIEDKENISKIMHRKSLCNTIAGNTCDTLTITNRTLEKGTVSTKPVVVVSARCHPGESNSSYVMHGLIEFLVSDCPEAIALRETYIFKIVPMLNPDGVIHGNYRCSLIGTDLNRRYKEAHSSLYPTIGALKRLLFEAQKNRGVQLFLDLHGHSKKKNAFCYGSDITLQSEKMKSITLRALDAEEIGKRRLFCRIFPKILCTLSDVHKGGYFSYRDCSFGVGANKKGTGRVVAWRELGIEGSFTIEVSFCGSGDNDEQKALKRYDEAMHQLAINQQLQTIKTGADESCKSNVGTYATSTKSGEPLSPRNTASSQKTKKIAAAAATPVEKPVQTRNEDPFAPTVDLEKIVSSYKSAVHYTKDDLKNMGKAIALSIFHFTNLDEKNLPKQQKYPSGIFSSAGNSKSVSKASSMEFLSGMKSPSNEDNPFPVDEDEPRMQLGKVRFESSDGEKDTDNDEGLRVERTGSQEEEEDKSGPPESVLYCDADGLKKPLLRPSVFTPEAIAQAYVDHKDDMKDDQKMLRLKCEISIRRALKAECPKCVIEEASVMIPEAEEPQQESEAEGGSDSEPSVDCMPTNKLIGRKKMTSLKDTAMIVKALRKAAKKRRRAAELAAEKREHQRQLEAQEAAAAAAAAAATKDTLNQLKNARTLTTTLKPNESVQSILRRAKTRSLNREARPILTNRQFRVSDAADLDIPMQIQGLGTVGAEGVPEMRKDATVSEGFAGTPAGEMTTMMKPTEPNGRYVVSSNSRSKSASATQNRSRRAAPVARSSGEWLYDTAAVEAPAQKVSIVHLVPDTMFHDHNRARGMAYNRAAVIRASTLSAAMTANRDRAPSIAIRAPPQPPRPQPTPLQNSLAKLCRAVEEFADNYEKGGDH